MGGNREEPGFAFAKNVNQAMPLCVTGGSQGSSFHFSSLF
jgi:hypothetical protein